LKVKANPQSKDDVVNNPYSWNANANLLFVDQPVGTGFSYSRWPLDYVTNEVQVAQQLYDFLQAFVAQYPQYTDRPLYITGESYVSAPALWRALPARANHSAMRRPATTCPPSGGRSWTPTRRAGSRG
jgi:carboxypeptidase C (cathepsin A)